MTFSKRTHLKVLESIKTIRESFVGSELVFLNGSCYSFYKILENMHPVKPYYSNSHIVCELNGYFYDITGEVKGDYVPFNENIVDYESIINNKFNGHLDHIQCPNCDELIRIEKV